MKKEYTIIELDNGSKVITYEENGFTISFSENADNKDYQEYLESLKDAAK